MKVVSSGERGSGSTNLHMPRYMNERQSRPRGIKAGWYAMNGDGDIAFGPFFNRETCLSRIFQLVAWSKSSALRDRPL